MNKRFLHTVLLLLLNVIILSGCNQNSDQREFEQQAFNEPKGITETDQNGNVDGSNDPDDWRVAPFFQGGDIEVTPPFPNPVQSNDRLTIDSYIFVLDRISEITITVYRPPSIYQLGLREQVSIGINTILLLPLEIANNNPNPQGIYRIIIQDENENVITYGDIEIE